MTVRACPRSGLRLRQSSMLTGAWAWSLPRLPALRKLCEGCHGRLGVSQKQARPLDADASGRDPSDGAQSKEYPGEARSRSEETALRRGRLDIALASVMSDAGLRISEAAALRWRDVT